MLTFCMKSNFSYILKQSSKSERFDLYDIFWRSFFDGNCIRGVNGFCRERVKMFVAVTFTMVIIGCDYDAFILVKKQHVFTLAMKSRNPESRC